MQDRAIRKPYSNVITKDSNQKSLGYDSPTISEIFVTYSNVVNDNTFTVTKFSLGAYEPTVFIDGRKQIHPKDDPNPTYYVDVSKNTIQLLGLYGIGAKVEVVSSYYVPTSEDEFVLYYETTTTKETNTFQLPWEFDYRNKGVTVFINGSLVANSLIRCPNAFTVDLVISTPINSQVVILARRLFMSPDLYSRFFATLPNGSILYYSGNTCPVGFVKADRSIYSRNIYPLFVAWILEDGNFITDETQKDNPINYGKFVFSADGENFYTPDLTKGVIKGDALVSNVTSQSISTSGSNVVLEYQFGYMPIIKADGPEKTGISFENSSDVFTRLDNIDNSIVILNANVSQITTVSNQALQGANEANAQVDTLTDTVNTIASQVTALNNKIGNINSTTIKSVKTVVDYTANAGDSIHVVIPQGVTNININLPDSPNFGDTVSVLDVSRVVSATNTITVVGGTHGIDNPGNPDGGDSYIIDIAGACVTFIYNNDIDSWFINIGGRSYTS